MSDTQQAPKNASIQTFLTGLASAAPTPGGGGAAAISGAMGAALVSMVCNLTIGKKLRGLSTCFPPYNAILYRI